MAKVDELILRHGRLLAKRGNFPTAWQDIADYIMPLRSDITHTRERGSERTQYIIDSTAIHASQLLASSMHGAVTPPQLQWHNLKLRDQTLNDDHRVQTWLEDATKRMHLARSQSNFNTEVGEFYSDYCRMNTGCLFVAERHQRTAAQGEGFGPKFQGLHYRAVPISEYCIDEGADGQVNTVFRKFKLSAWAVMEQFGQEKIGPQLLDIANKRPEQEVEILHAVYPRTKYRPNAKGYENMPFASCYVALGHKILLEEAGYDEMPYMVARWEKGSDGIWGVGPAFTALPEIRTLNRARELVLRNAGKVIDPPLKYLNDGSVGNIDTGANGRIAVEDMNSIQLMELSGRLDVSQFTLVDSRNLIKEIFFWQQLQLQEGPAMTATEIVKRVEMMQRILGPVLGRLEHELLQPLVNREFNIMLRRGAFLPIPEVLSGQDIDVEFEGPLARAQRSQVLTAFQEWMALIGPLVQVKPDILDVVDFDAAAQELADTAGVPSKFRRSAEAIAQIRQQRAQAEQAEQKDELMMRGAEAAGKAAPALKVLHGMTQSENGQEAA